MSGLSAWEALELLRSQVERRIGLKTLIVPLALKEPGLVAKIALRKVAPKENLFVDRRTGAGIIVRAAVSIESRIEGQAALSKAVTACESLARYALVADRLEDATGNPVPNTRLEAKTVEDDGVLEDPDNDKVAWVREEYVFTITLPTEK